MGRGGRPHSVHPAKCGPMQRTVALQGILERAHVEGMLEARTNGKMASHTKMSPWPTRFDPSVLMNPVIMMIETAVLDEAFVGSLCLGLSSDGFLLKFLGILIASFGNLCGIM